jgi:hypothetical protein
MTIEEYNKLYDIEKMRMAINTFAYCNETFLQRYNVKQLMKIHSIMVSCEWDFLADQWTERQLREALKGIVPKWDDNEKPVYAKLIRSTKKNIGLLAK